MDWLEALLLECQVAVQDFTQALEVIIGENFGEVGGVFSWLQISRVATCVFTKRDCSSWDVMLYTYLHSFPFTFDADSL